MYGNGALVDISNLYECYGKSLSQIADFIETIEPQQVALSPVAQGQEVGA